MDSSKKFMIESISRVCCRDRGNKGLLQGMHLNFVISRYICGAFVLLHKAPSDDEDDDMGGIKSISSFSSSITPLCCCG